MTGHRTRWLVLLALALVVTGGVFGAAANQVPAAERPPLGPVVISPNLGSWNDYQRPIIRGSEFDLAKVHLPTGFQTAPEHVEDLIADGITTIMLKTEDCRSDGATTRAYLVNRGFTELFQSYPDIDFVIQVGNEPERCPGTLAQYYDALYEVITQVKPEVDEPNLHWVAGLPMVPQSAIGLMEDEWVLDLYDGVGTNMLGHFSLVNEYHGWHEIVDYVLDETDTTLWLTEIGINHPPMDKADKARGILEYVDTLPADRVGGVAIFTLGRGTNWPQYEVTEAMVPVFADRDNCRFFAPTEQFLCGPFKQYWEHHGGLAIFGYPITAEEPGGNGETVQFMERSRFEWHPGVWPEQFDVLLGHLGREMIADRRNESPFQSLESDQVPGDTCVYFAATGQHLCDEFLLYWNTFGGLPIFGYPLSQEFTENGFTVQYFERARFEHQPGVWAERFDVLQGLLGVQAVEGTLISPPDPDDDDAFDDTSMDDSSSADLD
jgi:hypothetical protein